MHDARDTGSPTQLSQVGSQAMRPCPQDCLLSESATPSPGPSGGTRAVTGSSLSACGGPSKAAKPATALRPELAPLLTKTQIVGRVGLVVCCVELLIMLAAAALPHTLGMWWLAFIDAVLLVGMSTPLVYHWVVLPFVRARDQALAELVEQALTDPLTRLPNRRAVDERLRALLSAAARRGEFGAVLLLDLDDFKLINDRYSHQTGDAVLLELAHRLRCTLRAEDFVGRLGGDEFVVLLGALGREREPARDAAERVADKLTTLLGRPVLLEKRRLPISVSVGVRLVEPGQDGVELALALADAAMYHAKNAGGGAVSFAS